jgi:hypothetical protein
MKELAKRSATQLVKAIKDKQISSVELVEFFMERYHRLNPIINAIIATDFDAALKRAQMADEALARREDWGPLHGLPMTLKDGFETTGFPTTFGSPILRITCRLKTGRSCSHCSTLERSFSEKPTCPFLLWIRSPLTTSTVKPTTPGT